MDGKKPIFNDVLAFIWCKMDVIPRDTLLETVRKFYSLEVLIKARDLLASVSNSEDRFKQRKADTILVAIYDFMSTLKTDTDLFFVAINLNNIPCVELKNVDGAALVCRQDKLQMMVEQLLQEQKDMKVLIQNMRTVVTNQNGSDITAGQNHVQESFDPVVNQAGPAGNPVEEPSPTQVSYASVVRRPPGTLSPQATAGSSGGPAVKVRRKKPPPKVGSKAGTNLRAVPQVKKMRVFVSRLCPESTCTGVKQYVAEMLEDEVTVVRLNTRFPSYASYMVTCDISHKEKILCGAEWENGVIIRPFYGKLVVSDGSGEGINGAV